MNESMHVFMKTLLSLSVSGTLLLLFILGWKQFYKDKFSRCWQYYIWVLVALRFLLPFTLGTTVVGSLFEKLDTTVVGGLFDEMPASQNAPVSVNMDNSKAGPVQANGETAAAAMHQPLDTYVCLFFIWAALALVLFVRKITVYQGFIQYIKAGSIEVSDIKILNLLSDCEEKLHIRTSVELSCNPLITSPMMVGFFHPEIVLPAHGLEDKELSYIFAHELTHYRQKDLFYKWLIQMVACIHWFNPFVYLLEKEVNKCCELSCDEKVISVLDDKARHAYGDTLISFLKSGNRCKNSFASVTLTEGAEQLKERLGAIMKFKKKSKTVVAVTVVFSAIVCACFLATGAYAESPAVKVGVSAESPSVKDNATWKDSEIQNEVLTEDGVSYIFCDGAGEKDKPQTSVSAGSVKFVLVRKGGYASVGPFSNMATLMEDVTKQCAYMTFLTQEEKELVKKVAAGICGNTGHSPSYEKLIAYKTGNYAQQSVADFNAALAPTPDELTAVLAAQADVISTISPDDENYGFFTTTMDISTNELYCGHMGEEFGFYAGIVKHSRPYGLDEEGKVAYEFFCFADLWVTYSMKAPELLTVAERDATLLAFKEEMQNYLNGLSEAEITAGNFRTVLTGKATELADRLSTEHMTLSCEVSQIEISDTGMETDSIG